MESTNLEDILSECGVTPQTRSLLITDGWTVENFSCVVADETALDPVWDELVPDGGLTLFQKAALRAAYKRCRSKMDPSGPLVGSEAAASPEIPQSSSSWAESFAPKLDQTKINSLKEKFILLNWLIMKRCQVPDFCLLCTTSCNESSGIGCHGNIALEWRNLTSYHTSVRLRCRSWSWPVCIHCWLMTPLQWISAMATWEKKRQKSACGSRCGRGYVWWCPLGES